MYLLQCNVFTLLRNKRAPVVYSWLCAVIRCPAWSTTGAVSSHSHGGILQTTRILLLLSNLAVPGPGHLHPYLSLPELCSLALYLTMALVATHPTGTSSDQDRLAAALDAVALCQPHL